MAIKKVELTAPLQWLMRSVDAGGKQPGAIFGGASLAVAVILVASILAAMMVGAVIAAIYGKDVQQSLNVSMLLSTGMPMFAAIMAVAILMFAGMIGIVQRAEEGLAVKATDVFAGFRHSKWLALSALVALPLLSALISFGLEYVLGGPDYHSGTIEAIRNFKPGTLPVLPQPAHPVLISIFSSMSSWFLYGLLMLAITQVMLNGRSSAAAVTNALAAFFSNLPAMVFGGILMAISLIALGIAFALLTLLVVVLAAVVPLLGAILMFLMMIAMMILMLVVGAAISYNAWKAIFADTSVGSSSPPSQVEL